jgi:putative heme-binding domain-containing protein
VQAVRLVGRGLVSHADDALRLAALLVPQTPVELQRAAVNTLEIMRPENLAEVLLDQWSQLGPEIRPQVLDILLDEEKWTTQLLDRLEQGDISANELGIVNRGKLVLHGSPQVRSRASQLLNPATPAQRLSAIEQYRERLLQPANPELGRDVFRKHCALCHRLENEGTDIGPDLLALKDRSSESLLVAILDPNRAVEPRYVEYSATTKRGRVFCGIIASETGNSITLIDAQGIKHALLRHDLDELESTGRSLMPVGVEALLAKPEDLLDLIAYLRSVESDPAARRPEPRRQLIPPSRTTRRTQK